MLFLIRIFRVYVKAHVKTEEHGQLGAFGLNDTMNERRAGERHLASKNAQRSLSLPLGASALVAPLTPSASVTDEVTPGKEKRKPVHLEVGIFTDGTLNNAGNIDLFRDSDIGGGYHNNQTEQLLLHPKLTVKGNATAWPKQAMQWDNLTTLKMTADAEGWVGAQGLPLQGGEPASLSILGLIE